MKVISVLGIDLAKQNFQLHGNDIHGKVCLKKKLTRNQLAATIANLPPCLIAMEACASAHFWASKFKSFGHDVRLIAPQHVKPFVKGNKNDSADAEAIAEAASRPNMHFVPVKSQRHLDVQTLHRVRTRLVRNRTALCNEMRAILAEAGIIFNRSVKALKKGVIPLLAPDSELTTMCKQTIADLHAELSEVDDHIDTFTSRLERFAKEDETCRRLQTIRGIGLITSTAIVSSVPAPHHFKNGRQFSASLGLVPRHTGTGGKNKLLSISKRGDSYLRCLLVHGARSVIRASPGKTDKLSVWVNELKARKGYGRTAVALANKNARIVLAVMKSKGIYQPALACA